MTKEQLKETSFWAYTEEASNFCDVIDYLEIYPDAIIYILEKLNNMSIIEKIPKLYLAQVQHKNGNWYNSKCNKIFKSLEELSEYMRKFGLKEEFALLYRAKELI